MRHNSASQDVVATRLRYVICMDERSPALNVGNVVSIGENSRRRKPDLRWKEIHAFTAKKRYYWLFLNRTNLDSVSVHHKKYEK